MDLYVDYLINKSYKQPCIPIRYKNNKIVVYCRYEDTGFVDYAWAPIEDCVDYGYIPYVLESDNLDKLFARYAENK